MNRAFAVGALALLLVVACGVGALVLRSSQARNLPPEVQPIQTTADATVNPPANVESSTPVAPPSETDEFLSAHAVKKTATRQTRRHPIAEENVIETAPSRETPPAPAEVVTPLFEKPRAESAAKSTPSTPSPQLITPAKSAPPKGKVIQWP
jgi:cytoskeletal protein RodZ